MIRISHLLSLRISSLPTQALYRDRLDQVQAVCRKYGLGNRQNIIDNEKANAWIFNETRFNNDTRVETRFYERMLESASRPIEKSLMHLEKNSLLYCWIHKVRIIIVRLVEGKKYRVSQKSCCRAKFCQEYHLGSCLVLVRNDQKYVS